jgi:hypothetical protein
MTAARRAAGLFAIAFVLRLAFGLASELWGPDEIQVYLIGLQYYTTGAWPLYGPDIVYTQTQLPGALQGLLIGGPFWIAPIPEAPYVLLNLLSFGALLFFGWYSSKRLPDLPGWFLWLWLFFSPWTLNLSTHIVNPSYVLPGAIVFFVAAFELVPQLRRDLLPRPMAFFGLGFGVLWIYQVHLSAVLLVPIAGVVVLLSLMRDRRATVRGLGWTAAGALVAGATLIPTVVTAGVGALAASTDENISLELAHVLRLPELAAQYFSFATFEIARFLGPSTADRLAFLARYPWAAPFIVFGALCGVVQVGLLVLSLFARQADQRDWSAVRAATVFTLALLYGSFVLSVKSPASHAFYLVWPVVTIYSFYCWNDWFRRPALRTLAWLMIAASFVTHTAVAARNFTDRSLYTNREVVVRAIAEHNYRLVGERRPELWRR